MISSDRLSEEQRLLVESAEDFLTPYANSRFGNEQDEIIWQQIIKLGWAAVHVPKQYGGLGLGLSELGLLQQAMGRHLLRSPFFTSVVMVQTLLLEVASEEAKRALLPALIEGQQTGTLIFNHGLSIQKQTPCIKARQTASGWQLSGTAEQILDTGIERFALVVAELEEGNYGLFHVPADTQGVTRQTLAVWDLTRPQSCWTFAEVQLASDARIDVVEEHASLRYALQKCAALFALMLSAEQLGGSERCLEMTRNYTMERQQFGRSLASFQSIKHRCAQMLVEVEKTKSALSGVLAELDAFPVYELTQLVAIVRAQAIGCYRYCASEAIQLHGGVGFTWDYDPQLHFKRAQWSSQWFGSIDAWRECVASELLEA